MLLFVAPYSFYFLPVGLFRLYGLRKAFRKSGSYQEQPCFISIGIADHGLSVAQGSEDHEAAIFGPTI
jgi:hypothetical protein